MTVYPNSQSNPASAIPVWIAAFPGGGALSKNITTNASTLVKTGAGTFFGLSVNTAGTTSTATVYDGTSTAGVKLGTFSTVAQGGPSIPASGLAFTVGLFVVTAGGATADITVAYV
jgi:hypothetical protein